MRAGDSAHLDTSLILLVGDRPGVVRSFEPTLLRHGYIVSTVEDAATMRERALNTRPDAILLDLQLPDGSALDVCRALREADAFGPGPVVLLLTPGAPSRAQRLQALESGASDCVGPDEEELLLRLSALVRSRRAAERMSADSQFNATTGLYSLPGLMQRAHELAALMVRQHGPLACLVVALEPQASVQVPETVRVRVAQSIFSAGRRSDVRGQIGLTEFAILAPGTDAPGAHGLAQRLAVAARDSAERLGVDARVRVGYDAISNLGYEPLDPVALLQRARNALRDGRGGAARDSDGIRRFEGAPPPPQPRVR
jgi:CheY-like chemotaxis protein